MKDLKKLTEHVGIIIKNKNNEILFIKRSLKKKILPGAWSFPSGTREENESINETAIREAKEELGIDIEVEKLLTTFNLTELSVRLHLLVCKIKNDSPEILAKDEIDSFKFIKISDFFKRFNDNEIGHGLIRLRKEKELIKQLI